MQATSRRSIPRRIRRFTVVHRPEPQDTGSVADDLLPWADPYIAMLAARLRASAPGDDDARPVFERATEPFGEASPPLNDPGYDFEVPRQSEVWPYDDADDDAFPVDR